MISELSVVIRSNAQCSCCLYMAAVDTAEDVKGSVDIEERCLCVHSNRILSHFDLVCNREIWLIA